MTVDNTIIGSFYDNVINIPGCKNSSNILFPQSGLSYNQTVMNHFMTVDNTINFLFYDNVINIPGCMSSSNKLVTSLIIHKILQLIFKNTVC
jgi:Ni,Fe-hydrogenase I small subunit